MTSAEKVDIKLAQRGNEKSMEKLIDQYQGLIKSATHNIKPADPAYNQKDLDQLATMGFIKAVQRFNFLRGTELSTYAFPWINIFLREAIYKGKSNLKVDETRLSYEDEFGNKLGMRAHTNLPLHDRPLFFYAHKLLNRLPKLDKEIIKSYFGIDRDRPLSLEEIADSQNLDTDIIEDIIQDSIKFLRK